MNDQENTSRFDENTMLEIGGGEGEEDPGARAYVSSAVVKRLPRYFRYLRELIRCDRLRISSGELAKMMDITASQIRQDFNCFGGFGQQGYGYNVKYLYRKISEILGVTRGYNAIIVGCGNLGRALAGSLMFAKRGVNLIGVFDTDPTIIGREVAGHIVQDMAVVADFCREQDVAIAVLTIPRGAVVDTASCLAAAGVQGLWNFTNIEINPAVPGIKVQNVHMGDSLMMLCYDLGTN